MICELFRKLFSGTGVSAMVREILTCKKELSGWIVVILPFTTLSPKPSPCPLERSRSPTMACDDMVPFISAEPLPPTVFNLLGPRTTTVRDPGTVEPRGPATEPESKGLVWLGTFCLSSSTWAWRALSIMGKGIKHHSNKKGIHHFCFVIIWQMMNWSK